MNDRFDERLLAYLEGKASTEDRQALERELAASPSLAAELEEARRGLKALRGLAAAAVEPQPSLGDSVWEVARAESPSRLADSDGRRRASAPGSWQLAAAVAALLLLPASGWFARGWLAPPGTEPSGPPPIPGVATPPVQNPQMQNYLLLFTGAWPDMESLSAQERMQRQQEYMEWVGWLETEDRLIAGSELGGDGGIFLTSSGMGVSEFRRDAPPEEIVVGFVFIRAESPEEARQIAAECPHVRYGSGVLLKAGDGMAM
ncbi:MAG: YciI family protein [Gemmatimonadota bacterium]|nr:YciI family protein [Gemmatimonadota bacterium]